MFCTACWFLPSSNRTYQKVVTNQKKTPLYLSSNAAFMEPILYLFMWSVALKLTGNTSNCVFHIQLLSFVFSWIWKKCSRHVFRCVCNSVLHFSAIAIGMRASVQCSIRACRESCVKYKRQLHGVGREEIPIPVLMEQQVPPSDSYEEATSASCSSCPVKQTFFKTKWGTALVFTLCILNICNHIFRLSVGTSKPKFSAGAMFCSLHIPLLQFSSECPCRNRAVLRGLFMLYFASVHFWLILLSPRQYFVVNAYSFRCSREIRGLLG